MSYATDRLIKNARTSLPGSLDYVIQLELFNVLDDFLRNTSIWTEDVSLPVTAADPAGTIYYIEPESVSTIVRLMGMKNSQGFPQNAFMDTPGEITFPMPVGNDDEFTATVALSIIDPVRGDGFPQFPAWILDKWGTGILSGVLARMMLQPAKPYTNEKLAGTHLRYYRRAVSYANTEALHNNVHGMQSWYFPQQFATRTRRR
jgi:hypothetical protein